MTAQAAGADAGAGRQAGKGQPLAAEQGIERVRALQHHFNDQPGNFLHRHVFHRVHGDIRISIEQGFFKFFQKKAFSSDLRQWPVKYDVTLGYHRQEFYPEAGITFPEQAGNMVGLPQRQFTFSGCYFYCFSH